MIFFLSYSEFMLAKLIRETIKKSFHFKDKRLTEILQGNTIYQFIKPFLDCTFEEYGAL